MQKQPLFATLRLVGIKIPFRIITDRLDILIEDCKREERSSQKKLYMAFYGYAMAICMRYSNSEDDALEIMNDGFLKIYKGLEKFTPKHGNLEADFRAWLKQIMVFTAIDYFRKNEKHWHSDGLEATVLQIAHADENQIEKLTYKEIIEIVQKLSPAYRTVFCLFVLDGLSHEEISQCLGISVGTSKSNLSKAKANLQKMLEPRNTPKNYERKVV